MSEFIPVNCRNIETTEPYFSACTNRICDNTAGVTFQWRNIFQTHFVIAGETLVTRSVYKRIGPCYSVPVGPGDADAGFAAAERDARERTGTMLSETMRNCEQMESEARVRCAEMLARAKAESQAYWDDVSSKLESYYQQHAGLRELLSMSLKRKETGEA